METTTETKYETTVAARVAGEDIKQGDYVTVLNEIVELPSFLWSCSGGTLPADEPVRLRYMPSDAGQPFKVVAVCLPFVYAKRPKGGTKTFDTRQNQLVRLDPVTFASVCRREELCPNTSSSVFLVAEHSVVGFPESPATECPATLISHKRTRISALVTNRNRFAFASYRFDRRTSTRRRVLSSRSTGCQPVTTDIAG